MTIDTSCFNILERLVSEQLNVGASSPTLRPRLLVRRLSVDLAKLEEQFSNMDDWQGFRLTRLVHAGDVRDWTSCFHLDSRANRVQRDVIELDFAHYCDLGRDSHREIVFSFSSPVATDDGYVLYCSVNRGFLAGHAFLCSYRDSFESPQSLNTLHLWQS